MEKKEKRNVSVILDVNGNKIVVINDILFKGKKIDWNEVAEYLKRYVGEFYTIAEEGETVYIGKELPDEYTRSKYSTVIRGKTEKVKANAVQGLPEMIENATGKQHTPNKKQKHKKDAKYGWYKYETRFAIPVFADTGEVEQYKVFRAAMIIRHGADNKKYIYDIINIKKETGDLFKSEDPTQ